MKAKRFFSNLLQLLSFPIVILVGLLFIEIAIPGNGAMCDPDALIISYIGFIGVLSLIVFLTTAINDLFNKSRPKLRITLITIICLQFLVLSTISPIYSLISFHQLTMKVVYQFPSINLEFYENNIFYYRSKNSACSEEFIGKYSLVKNRLNLQFTPKSLYLSSEYIITQDSLKPLNKDFLSFKLIK